MNAAIPASPLDTVSDQREMEPVLRVEDLRVRYRARHGTVEAVRGVSLHVAAGETVAIVGESGSGKSTTAHAIIRLLADNAELAGGSVRFDHERTRNARSTIDLVTASDRALRSIRGRGIGFVPQDPTVSLNPVERLGVQVGEVLRIHGLADRRSASAAAIEALERAGIPDPAARARQYPHELSGGLRQRVLIAIAVIARPRLLIADEPTSALDVTVQRHILDHLDELRRERGMGMLLITHDLGVAADRADRILVMANGQIVEEGRAAELLTNPTQPYTRELVAAAPSLRTAATLARPVSRTARATVSPASDDRVEVETTDPGTPLVRARDLVKRFGSRADGFTAVRDVSFDVHRGETFALVGESGSGKSTTARLVLGLETPTSGHVAFDGIDVSSVRGQHLRALRRRAQLVQQNPYASLNPKLTVSELVRDPLDASRTGTHAERKARVAELLDLVALPSHAGARRAAELSGGQRQRVAIARALALRPELVVLDEPVSALDVSVQHQVLTLLADLQRTLGVSYLFISHDLAVVRQIAHRVGVLHRGELHEVGPVERVLHAPRTATTRALLAAIPGRRLAALANATP